MYERYGSASRFEKGLIALGSASRRGSSPWECIEKGLIALRMAWSASNHGGSGRAQETIKQGLSTCDVLERAKESRGKTQSETFSRLLVT